MNEALQTIWDFIVEVWTTELFGPDTVTIGGILMLVFLFASVIIVERILQRLLIRRFLSKTRLQPSLQYGLSRIIGYTLIAIGFYVALQVAGLDLSSLPLVPAPAGVGVGAGGVSEDAARRSADRKGPDMAQAAEQVLAGTGGLPAVLRTPEPEVEQPSEAEAPDTEAQDGGDARAQPTEAEADPSEPEDEDQSHYAVAAE